MSDCHADTTAGQKAAMLYAVLVNAIDGYPDGHPVSDWAHQAEDLWRDLRSPYCREDGCCQPHMDSFPWCPWHRPASYPPLPADFPPYPQEPGQ